ncbi:MAG: CBS domain-containing protein [Proteobacteria bacterium]|nr:CBS domain-containing protein [Pseudomonadota bacterium]
MNEDRLNGDSGSQSLISRIASLFSRKPKTKQDLEDVLTMAADDEVIDHDARSIIEGAMQVGEMQARDIMIPRAQMKVIKSDCSLEEILPQIISSAHSRYPVVGENPDDILGMLLAKDLLPQILSSDHSGFNVADLLRKIMVVPESKRLNILLREFRERHNHMAIVIDEYGGVAGLVTIEDVLEEIVGEIEDETDVETDNFIHKIMLDDYFVKALTPIDEFNSYFSTEFSDEEFDTIGGLVIQAFGHMPTKNETIIINGFEFKVINADLRKIHSLRMRPVTSE